VLSGEIYRGDMPLGYRVAGRGGNIYIMHTRQKLFVRFKIFT
jgi:hypothetical protein